MTFGRTTERWGAGGCLSWWVTHRRSVCCCPLPPRSRVALGATHKHRIWQPPVCGSSTKRKTSMQWVHDLHNWIHSTALRGHTFHLRLNFLRTQEGRQDIFKKPRNPKVRVSHLTLFAYFSLPWNWPTPGANNEDAEGKAKTGWPKFLSFSVLPCSAASWRRRILVGYVHTKEWIKTSRVSCVRCFHYSDKNNIHMHIQATKYKSGDFSDSTCKLSAVLFVFETGIAQCKDKW